MPVPLGGSSRSPLGGSSGSNRLLPLYLEDGYSLDDDGNLVVSKDIIINDTPLSTLLERIVEIETYLTRLSETYSIQVRNGTYQNGEINENWRIENEELVQRLPGDEVPADQILEEINFTT